MELWHEVTGEGPPVVLIHEGICDGRMWDPQWDVLSRFHRTVRCDLRGFGQTPLPAEPYSNARDVVELLDHLWLGAAALVGVSLGGRVALEVALARPDLVERLVLVGTALPGRAWSETVRRYQEEEDAAIARGDLDAAVEANLRMWVDGPNRLPDEVDPTLRRFVGEMERRALELQVPLWEEVDEELLVPDVGTSYVTVRVPTLVIVGSEDVLDIQEVADRLASAIPGARKVTMAGTAHVPSLERPQEFNELLLSFLGERDGTP
jgi:3-oxoadipate enol-lactonase